MKKLSYIEDSLTVPNILSVIRIILIIPFVFAVMNDDYLFAGIMLVLSGISDLLDGIIARRFNQVTALGKMLDPIADKLTLVAVMICVGLKLPRLFPFTVILVVKEISMLIAGAILLKRRQVPLSARWYGKAATIVFYFSVIIIITCKAVWNVDNPSLNIVLMSITVLCMVYALMRYLKIFISMINNSKIRK